MKKLAIILSVIVIIGALVACTNESKIRVTENQFWNGLLSDEEIVVYDTSNNSRRFVKENDQNVQCVAIKDYKVYVLYEYANTAGAFDEVLNMLKSWHKNDADIEVTTHASGLLYVMNGNANNCNVCYVSDRTIVLGLGNSDERDDMIKEIEMMVSSDDSEYDSTKLHSLLEIQNPAEDIKKVSNPKH